MMVICRNDDLTVRLSIHDYRTSQGERRLNGRNREEELIMSIFFST